MGSAAGRSALKARRCDWVFIGSCTNGRLSDLREAAKALSGRKVADGVRAWIVPGSVAVKRRRSAKACTVHFSTPGFEWREPGCSMCVGANGDIIAPGQRSRLYHQSQFCRPSRARRPHPFGKPDNGRCRRGHRTYRRHPQNRPLTMEKFERLTGAAAPLMRININTEIIIPINRLISYKRGELGPWCFEAWRYAPEGVENPRICPQQTALSTRQDPRSRG